MARVTLRRATTVDAHWLDLWDRDADVIACSTDDPNAKIAFDDVEWREELATQDEHSQYYIGELDGRPIGVMQICDPHLETSHYWAKSRLTSARSTSGSARRSIAARVSAAK